jgi:hypothetical protein
MTANQFRKLALSLPDVVESAHMHHPDFRVRNKIFATLGYPDERCGMVRLTPDQQTSLLHSEPGIFRAASGAWGRSGSTVVLLSAAKVDQLRPVMRQAWDNISAPSKRDR